MQHMMPVRRIATMCHATLTRLLLSGEPLIDTLIIGMSVTDATGMVMVVVNRLC